MAGPAEPEARRNVVMLGPACGCEAAVATDLLGPARRCSGPGLQNELRVLSSKSELGVDAQAQAGWTASRPAGSRGPSWPLPLDMPGGGAGPEPGLDTEQPEAPADAEAVRGDSSPPLPNPRRGPPPSADGWRWQPVPPRCLDWAWRSVSLHRPERLRARGWVSYSLSSPGGRRGTNRPGLCAWAAKAS